jgi:predicted O-linked N-acetylglucosamine transferase (SPINDLY family)
MDYKAITYLNEAISLNSEVAEYYNELGGIYSRGLKPNLAIENFNKALKLNISREVKAILNFNIGQALYNAKNYISSDVYFKKSIELNSFLPDTWTNLGLSYYFQKKYDLAIDVLKKSISINVNHFQAYNSLSLVYLKRGMIFEAKELLEKCLQLNPNYSAAWMNLGKCQITLRFFQQGISSFLKAFELNKSNLDALSNYLCSLSYSDQLSENFILQEHIKYSPHFLNRSKIINYKNKTEKDIVNIAYVSGDFNRHSVAEFLLPVIKNHNRSQFRIYCLSNNKHEDDYTKLFQQYSNFINIFDKNDDDVIDFINKNNIDILIDLSGHTAFNRMTLFACKPCKIQINWIGYATTTGLESMDYRFVDQNTDIDKENNIHIEKKIKFRNFFSTFNRPLDYKIKKPPCLIKGYITFGSFNNTNKLSDSLIKTWSEILCSDYNNKLILKNIKFRDVRYIKLITNEFIKNGVKPNQLRYYEKLGKEEHFNLYNEVDIALDTFPYNGVTTSFEALWMGVPLIALKGDTHIGRVTYSILKNLNLTELFSYSKNDYINKAINLSTDIDGIIDYKSNLRQKLLNSNLLDSAKFTKELEEKYFGLLN